MPKSKYPITVEALAREIGGSVRGDKELLIQGAAGLEEAGPEDLSFIKNGRFISQARNSNAGCLIVNQQYDLPSKNLIEIEGNAHRAFTIALRLLFPDPTYFSGVSKNSIVHSTVNIGENVHVATGAIVEENCNLGARTVILGGAHIGKGCCLGEACVIHPGVVLYPYTSLGNRVIIKANSVIGGDGFGFDLSALPALRMPQVGTVVIEDDVQIGSCTCIDRATLGVTRIGARTKIDNLVAIGHNVSIGEDTVVIAQSGIAGSALVGHRCLLSGQVGVRGNRTKIGNDVKVLAKSAVLSDIEDGMTVAGIPAVPHHEWKRAVALQKKLGVKLKRIFSSLRSIHGCNDGE